MSQPAVRVMGLSKEYHTGLRRASARTLRETIVDAVTGPLRRTAKLLRGHATGAAELDATHWALRDVSFEIPRGDVVGVIGQNGAGKSTLLKILSRITEPTQGFAEIRGRVGSLLEVGTGFHQELTGRENVYLNGAILGMRKCEIDRKFDEIVAFAEIDKFLDTPVKHYSSGMYVRLAFAVAAHLEPEILLVDEVLSVGDVSFQRKCLGKMNQIHRSGRTVLFVSHNMATVENLCSETMVFHNGEVAFFGPSKEAVQFYLQSVVDREVPVEAGMSGRRWANPRHQKFRSREEIATLTGIEFMNPERETIQFVRSGEPLVIRVHYRANKECSRPIFGVGISTELDTVISRVSTWLCGIEIPTLTPSDGFIDLCLDAVNLTPGGYFISAHVGAPGPIYYDSIDRCSVLNVKVADFYGSGRVSTDKSVIVLLPCHWECAGLRQDAENTEKEEWSGDGLRTPDSGGELHF